MNGAGKFLFLFFFFLFSFFIFHFSFDEYYHEEKVGWNDLAFLSVFFPLLSFFFLVLGAQGGRMGWESFCLAAAERKGKKENRTERNGTGLASDNDGDGRNLSSCSEENGKSGRK